MKKIIILAIIALGAPLITNVIFGITTPVHNQLPPKKVSIVIQKSDGSLVNGPSDKEMQSLYTQFKSNMHKKHAITANGKLVYQWLENEARKLAKTHHYANPTYEAQSMLYKNGNDYDLSFIIKVD